MKRVRMQGDSSDVRDAKFSSKIYKKKPSLLKLAKLGSEDVVFRYQAVTSDYLQQGFHALTWGHPLGYYVPMHIYSLSMIPNGGIGPHSGACGIQCGWAAPGNAAADRTSTLLNGIDNNSLYVTAAYDPEVNGAINYTSVTKALHKWTSIKMQLYGAMEDDVKFTVSVVKFKQDFANLWSAGLGNGEAKVLQDYLVQPYCSNRINATNQRTGQTLIKVLKEWNVVVPRLSDEVSLQPNSRELNIFMRHNWLNDYNWPNNNTVAMNDHNQSGQLGFGVDVQKHNAPLPDRSIFLIVRATSPKAGNDMAEFKKTSGTYNIVIRNAFTVPV